MDWHEGVPLAGHNDVLLVLAGFVLAVGVLGAARQAAVGDAQGRVALVAVRLPVLALDVFLGADGVDVL